ncbi:MAG: hypothetical protein NTW56_08200 [Alphaproteobacteria bacterium]|nr:hypothetical protein [Alphaproteobacteria bacterium]
MTGTHNARTHLVERALAGRGWFGQEAPPADAAPEEMEPPRPSWPVPIAHPAPPAIPLARLHAAGMISAPHGPGRSKHLEEIALVQQQVLRQVDGSIAQGLAKAMAHEPAHGPAKARVVLIASALPDEGKSFVALNLAASIAASGGRQALLVDADGRLGSISAALGAADAPGLRDLAADPALNAAPLVLPTALERLSFLPYGMPSAAQKDMPSGSAMAAAVARIAAALPGCVILLDPPPCLSTSDAGALAAIAGQVVLVVDAQRTARNEVEAALDVLEACPVLQLLLNRVHLAGNDSFGAQGAYEVPHAG